MIKKSCKFRNTGSKCQGFQCFEVCIVWTQFFPLVFISIIGVSRHLRAPNLSPGSFCKFCTTFCSLIPVHQYDSQNTNVMNNEACYDIILIGYNSGTVVGLQNTTQLNNVWHKEKQIPYLRISFFQYTFQCGEEKKKFPMGKRLSDYIEIRVFLKMCFSQTVILDLGWRK